MLWSHSRNVLLNGFTSGMIYDIPLWLPAEVPDFEYGVIRHPERLLIYAFPTRNNIRTLLQESKDVFIHNSPQDLLRDTQGRDKAEGAGQKALA
jgi:hypothetical protein